jgi:D5 N terminal like/RepB DNA-primase from phage plasmid
MLDKSNIDKARAPNLMEANGFLSALGPDAEAFDFRTFDDSELERPQLTRTFGGSLVSIRKPLAGLSAGGAGIFVTLNETDGKGISAANVTRVRALFVDLDGAPLANLACLKLQPSIIVSTSPGRYHAYYLVEGVRLEEFSELQTRLAALLGGDPKVKDLPRVMRLPGFPHRKGDPFMVTARYASTRLVRTRGEIVCKLDDAERHFGIAPPKREPWPEFEPSCGNGPATDRDRAYAQAALDGECAEVTRAREGTRNDRLNKAAASLGGLVAGGLLSRMEVEGRLLDAAKASGLGFDESRKTIASGLRHGLLHPRGRPNGEDQAREEAGDEPPPHEPKPTPSVAPAFSEDALALRFAKQHTHELRYVAAWGKWLAWNGTHWEFENTLAVFDMARKICRQAASECNKASEAKGLSKGNTVAAVEMLARADRRIAATIGQWDSDPWLLNTPGAVVDLRSGQTRQNRPDDYATKVTSVAPGGRCPQFLEFLATITNCNADLIDYLQRVFGYCLTSDTSEHALFFLHGAGANGSLFCFRPSRGFWAATAERHRSRRSPRPAFRHTQLILPDSWARAW